MLLQELHKADDQEFHLCMLSDVLTGCPRCSEDGRFPHPQSCGHFCVCTAGFAEKKKCPPHMQFDSDHLVCDWKNDSDCDRKSFIPTASKGVLWLIEDQPFKCEPC